MPVVAHVSDSGLSTWILLDEQRQPVVVVNEFLQYLGDRGKAPNTIRAYGYDLQYLLRFLQREGLLFTDLRPRHTVTFMHYLRTEASRTARRRLGIEDADSVINGRHPTRLSDSTVARVLAAMSTFYEFLIVSELYESENPLLQVPDGRAGMASDRPRPALGNSSRQQPVRRRINVSLAQRLPRPMPREHVELFLNSLTTLRDRAFFMACVNGGLRPSEALTLRLPNIHYGLRRLTIKVVDGDPRGLRTKSRVERTVDLYDEDTLAALSAYVMNERPQGAESDVVFLVGRNGKRRLEPLSYSAIHRVFVRHVTKLGLRTPSTSPHALRHTHATELFEHGMREMTLQKRLGHASPQSTKVYTRVSDKVVRDDYIAALSAIRASLNKEPK